MNLKAENEGNIDAIEKPYAETIEKVTKSDKYISNDNDIITIVTGFKAITKLCMKFDEPDKYES